MAIEGLLLHLDGHVVCDEEHRVAVLGWRGPGKRRKITEAHVSAGPTTLEDLFRWSSEALQRCSDYGAANGVGPSPSSCLATCDNIVVTTTYSGAYTIEHVCKVIELELAAGAYRDIGLKACRFRLYAATEVDESCRRLIMGSKFPPEHVFGDVCDRLPGDALHRMNGIQQVLLKRAQDKIKEDSLHGKARLAVFDEMGARCRSKLIHVARKAFKQMHGDCAAFCYIHCQRCLVWPQGKQEMVGIDPPAPFIHLEAGGRICTAFSSQNWSPWRWLHASAVPCIVWLCSVEAQRPAFLLQECSDNFDTESVLSEVFSDDGQWSSDILRLCPQDVGSPMTRMRKYSWRWTRGSSESRWTSHSISSRPWVARLFSTATPSSWTTLARPPNGRRSS